MKDERPLRVAFPVSLKLSDVDPASIQLSPEYAFLELIYSPLIRLDRYGQYVPFLAKDFRWENGSLSFSLRDNIVTAQGHTITARDAALSLKRIMILEKNTHGNLRKLLCDNDPMIDLESNCSGITVSNNTLTLHPKGGSEFVLRYLSAIDYAIIPESAIDVKTLKITNMRDTTGPYFVDSASGTSIILKANASHPVFSSGNGPKQIGLPTIICG